MGELTTWMLSRDVARVLGVKTNTLAKWRINGKGPKNWKRTSATTVHYSVQSVIEFQQTWDDTAETSNDAPAIEARRK